MRIRVIQKLIDKVRGKKYSSKNPVNINYDNIQYNKLIITKGFFYSGSSAVLGLLEEFTDTFIYGNHDNFFSKKKKEETDYGSEIAFFHESGIFDFINAFKLDSLTPLQKDVIIKCFIKKLCMCYQKKQLSDWDWSPNFYNSIFLEVSLKLIENVVQFSNYDMEIIKKFGFPSMIPSKLNDEFYKCSFIYGKGARTHAFLKFKNISNAEFDSEISLFIHRLLNTIKFDKKIVVYDQLLSMEDLDRVNQYMQDVPLKQICVYRDPRDHFMSLFKNDHRGLVPRKVEEFVDWYKKQINDELFKYNPNRLVIKFEDLVLNYDETTKKIMDFVGLKPEDHVAPKSVFDPEISKVNIGAWKEFIDQDFMKKIAEALPEYCYNEKE